MTRNENEPDQTTHFTLIDYVIFHSALFWIGEKFLRRANGSGRIVGLIELCDSYCTRAAR
jgi:hypothetical protein